MSDSIPFGRRLKQLRKAHDLTQAELARQVGYAEVTIQKIEGGALRPSRQFASRLAEHFGLAAQERAAFIAAVCLTDGGARPDAVVAQTDLGAQPPTHLLDGLAALLDSSLIQPAWQPGDERRLRMLETMRAYALEQLAASGALEATRRRHARYALWLAEAAIAHALEQRV